MANDRLKLVERSRELRALIKAAVSGDQSALVEINTCRDKAESSAAWKNAVYYVFEGGASDAKVFIEIAGDYGTFLLGDLLERRGDESWLDVMKVAARSVPEAMLRVGIAFWKSGEYESAWHFLDLASEKGSGEAITLTAWSFLLGRGKEQSFVAAVEWFVKLLSNEEPVDSWLFLDEDRFNPINYGGDERRWGDVGLLVCILEKCAPDEQRKIMSLIPDSDELVELRWVAKSEVADLGNVIEDCSEMLNFVI